MIGTGSVTNTATADGDFDDADTTNATDTDTATTEGHDCTISIDKTVDDDNVCAGDTVTYSYVVTNNSDEFTWTGDITDDNGTPGDPLDDFTVASGVVVGPSSSSTTYTHDSVIGTGSVTNTATADGDFDDADTTNATDTDTATTEGHDCTISIDKTVDDDNVCAGDTVTYSYVVTNNSDEFTWTGDITDDNGTPGDPLDDFTVASGVVVGPSSSSTTYTHDSVIGTGSVTNTATADGDFDDADTTNATDTDTATTEGHDCTISIDKTVDDDNVCAGDTVTYSYVVTNNSDEFTWTGDITDDNGTPGDPLDDFTVASGVVVGPSSSSTTYTHDSVIGTGSVTNTATADGDFDDADTTNATDTDTATTEGHDCTISITKVPDLTDVCNGDTVGYTITVTNNSDEFTWTGDVEDDVLGVLETGLVLAPGASKVYTPSHVINGSVTNTVTATGNFDDPASTSANADDSATVVGAPCGEGCTPGFWQGGFGVDLWNEVDDPDWTDAGGDGTNPFVTTDLFSTGPWGPSGIASIDNKTMLQIVGSGGGNSWARKAARDLVAAYLNASFGLNAATTTEILDDWADAVAAGTSGFRAFHDKYAALNELGCPIGASAPVAASASSGAASLALALGILPLLGILLVIPGWTGRRRQEA